MPSPAPDSSAWRDEAESALQRAFADDRDAAPAPAPEQDAAPADEPPPPPEAPRSPVQGFQAEAADDVPADEPATEATEDPRDAEIAALKAQVESMRTQRNPDIEAMMERQRAIEERLAKEEDDRIDRDLAILEQARERLVADRDEFDPAAYDRIVRKQEELRRQQDARRTERARTNVPVSPDRSAALSFASEHRMSDAEQQQLGVFEQYRCLQEPALQQMEPRARWSKLLSEMRGTQQPAGKPAAARPQPKHSSTMPGKQSVSAGRKAADLSGEEERIIRGILGTKYYSKERAAAVKEAAERRREEDR